MTVDLSNLPRHVTLAAGESIEIPLPSYADSGNTWSATCVRNQEVAHVSVELGDVPAGPAPPTDGSSEPPPLMFVPERAVVYGLACGEATWQLVLARSFGRSETVATHELRVTVMGTQ